MYFILSIFLSICLIIDFIFHKKSKIKRTKFDNILLIGTLTSCLIFAGIGINSNKTKEIENKENLYIAYQYFTDDKIDTAKEYLNQIKGNYEAEATIMLASISMEQLNYAEANTILNRDVSSSNYVANLKNELQTICNSNLSQENDTSSTVDEYVQNLELVNQTNLNYDYKTNIGLLIDEIDYSDEELINLTEQYHKQNIFASTNIENINILDVENYIDEYGSNEAILQTQSKVYAYNREYDKAIEVSEEILQEYPSLDNYIYHTNLIAQVSHNNELSIQNYGVFNYEGTDTEILKKIEKAEELYTQIENLEEDDEAYIKINEGVTNLLLEANQIPIKKAINYVLYKKGMLTDRTGEYDLQLAKLYFLQGEEEKANEILYDLLENVDTLNDDSKIKESLKEINSILENTSIDELDVTFTAAIRDLMKQQEFVISAADESINEIYQEHILSTLKYNKIDIHISQIDITEYPKITSYLNINGITGEHKELAQGLRTEDFKINDTQFNIRHFAITDNSINGKINISIVVDNSGSMYGDAIINAKYATEQVIQHMNTKNQQIAIVSYDSSARTLQQLTNDTNALLTAANSMNAIGGTNISSGLLAGISTLENASGFNAIILMTDGQDSNYQAIYEATNLAIANNIPVFTVAFGNSDTRIMNEIATMTGGKFIKAIDSSELDSIYLMLQNYIINNYVLEYVVEDNVDVINRSLTVEIPDYKTKATKNYSIANTNTMSGIITDISDNQMIISSITPNKVNMETLNEKLPISIYGHNFTDIKEVYIGNAPLKNINVISKNEISGEIDYCLRKGSYDVRIVTNDNREVIGYNLFNVYKTGDIKNIKIGTTNISADEINEIGNNQYLASGNILINGFIHSSDNIIIEANNLTQEDTYYTAASGKLTNVKYLYISYAINNTDPFVNFAKLNGKNATFYTSESIKLNKDSASLVDLSLTIPMFGDFAFGNGKIMPNFINYQIKSGEFSNLFDAITKAKTSKKIKEKKPSSSVDINVAFAPANIHLGGGVTLKNYSFPISWFKLSDVTLYFNTKDIEEKYVEISGKISFDCIPFVEGIGAKIATKQFNLNKVELSAAMKDIIIAYVISLDEISGGAENISESELADLAMYIQAKGSISPFEKVNQNVVKKSLINTLINDIKLADLKLKIQIDGKDGFTGSTEASVFDVVNAKVIFKTNLTNFDLSTNVNTKVNFVILSISGDIGVGVGLSFEENSVYVSLAGKGDIAIPALRINEDGNFDVLLKLASGKTTKQITINGKKSWLNDNDMPILKNAVYAN